MFLLLLLVFCKFQRLCNYTHIKGVDEYGESVNGSMYRHLYINAPKEVLEYPDYTFKEYSEKKRNVRDKIKFNILVKNCVFDEKKNICC